MALKLRTQGFTLIELMIVITIIGILASIAIPVYQDQIKRSKFSEVILAVSSVKGAIELAVQTGGATTETQLNESFFGIPSDSDLQASVLHLEHVDDLDVENGVIMVLGADSVDNLNFVMTATIDSGSVRWAKGGSCLSRGLC